MVTNFRRVFRQALESLPDTYQRLLVLYEINRLDAEYTARVLGMTSAQARIGLFHARRALRRRLTDRMVAPVQG